MKPLNGDNEKITWSYFIEKVYQLKPQEVVDSLTYEGMCLYHVKEIKKIFASGETLAQAAWKKLVIDIKGKEGFGKLKVLPSKYKDELLRAVAEKIVPSLGNSIPLSLGEQVTSFQKEWEAEIDYQLKENGESNKDIISLHLTSENKNAFYLFTRKHVYFCVYGVRPYAGEWEHTIDYVPRFSEDVEIDDVYCVTMDW